MTVVSSGKQVIFTNNLPLFEPRTRVASASEHSALLLKKSSNGRAVRSLSFPLLMMLLFSVTSSAKGVEIFKEQ